MMHPRPLLMHPRDWRAFMRGWAEDEGLSREEMRAQLLEAGHDLDPWRVPLPVIQPEPHRRAMADAVALFEGALFGMNAGGDRLGGQR